MKWWYLPALAALLLALAGCSALSLPRGEEPGGAALLSVLGVRQWGRRVEVSALPQRTEGEELPLFQGTGGSVAEAVQIIRSESRRPVSRAHVEHILLEEGAVAAQLSPVLAWSFRDGEQSTETNLWVLLGETMPEAFSGEADLALQLEALKKSAQAGEVLPLRTLRALSSQMALEGSVLIPALTWEGEALTLTGYAVCQEGALVGVLTGDAARGAALLAGEEISWPMTVAGEALSVEACRCRVRALWEDYTLTGMAVDCRVEGRLTQHWGEGDAPRLEKTLADQVAATLEGTARQLQAWGVDGPGLCRRAGLAAPWRWNALREQWQACFSQLSWEIDVKADLV